MRPFAYERAADPAAAVATAVADPTVTFLAGGTNLVDHLRLGIASPERIVDISGLPLNRVERTATGDLRIGAMVRNADLATHPEVRRDFPVLSRALLAGASGQIRNAATTGGNLLQRTRCSYFQDVSTPCNKREPGSGCSALEGYHKMHAVLGASEHCIATHPSDMAVALVALDATLSVLGANGERTIPVRDLHRLPGDEPQRDTVLRAGDLITAVTVPTLPFARSSTYRKVRERASYAFALVSVAAALDVADGRVRDARIALGGVAHKPWRAQVAEDTLRGQPATEDTFRAAAEAELAAADPLPDLAWKVTLAVSTITHTLATLATEEAR